jgi:hypothetical protein
MVIGELPGKTYPQESARYEDAARNERLFEEVLRYARVYHEKAPFRYSAILRCLLREALGNDWREKVYITDFRKADNDFDWTDLLNQEMNAVCPRVVVALGRKAADGACRFADNLLCFPHLSSRNDS